MEQFRIKESYIPLIQLLKALNWVESGGQAQLVVSEGLVRYNGDVEHRKRLKVRAGDRVEFDGRTVEVIQ